MKVVRYRSNEGCRSGLLISEGSKYLKIILMDNPIRVHKIPKSEAMYIKELDYSVTKCKRKLRQAIIVYHGSLCAVSKETRLALEEEL